MHVVKLFSIWLQKFNWSEFCKDNHEEHDEENRFTIMNIISLWFFDISSAKYTKEVFNTIRSVINWKFCDTRNSKKFRKHWTSWTLFTIISTTYKKKIKLELEFIPILIISNNFYNFPTFNNFRFFKSIFNNNFYFWQFSTKHFNFSMISFNLKLKSNNKLYSTPNLNLIFTHLSMKKDFSIFN